MPQDTSVPSLGLYVVPQDTSVPSLGLYVVPQDTSVPSLGLYVVPQDTSVPSLGLYVVPQDTSVHWGCMLCRTSVPSLGLYVVPQDTSVPSQEGVRRVSALSLVALFPGGDRLVKRQCRLCECTCDGGTSYSQALERHWSRNYTQVVVVVCLLFVLFWGLVFLFDSRLLLGRGRGCFL